jgi:hypothetical protein
LELVGTKVPKGFGLKFSGMNACCALQKIFKLNDEQGGK